MKSFEINYRGVTTTISAKNEESIVILINDSKEQAFKSPISKLESFYKLEALLKKRGLL